MAAKVLVVEDNNECRALAVMLLEYLGCTVSEAIDGLDGIGKAVIDRPDLILMDLNAQTRGPRSCRTPEGRPVDQGHTRGDLHGAQHRRVGLCSTRRCTRRSDNKAD